MSLRKAVSTAVNHRATSQGSEVAVIKVPKYVKKHVESLKLRDMKRKFDVMRKVHKRGDTSFPIISANKKEYNFYFGQVYNKNYPIPIMSRYWMRMTSAGQKFTINPWAPNPSLPVKLEIPPGITENDSESMAHFITEFSQLNLADPVLNAVTSMGFERPTPIQAMMIPKMMDKKHTVCVSETGAGKTMSYLIPIIHNLMKMKTQQARFPETPLALVIVPGRELAEQIAKVAYTLGAPCGINVRVLIPDGTELRPLVPRSGEEVDLLIASFGVIKTLSFKGIFKLSHLQHLVLDEADTLLDDSFAADMKHFFKRILVKNPEMAASFDGFDIGAKLSFVSSTMPSSFAPAGGFERISFERAISPHMHRVLPHVPQKFIRVNRENRQGVFLEIAKKDFEKKVPLMIFCHDSSTCDWASHFLKSNDVHNVRFHAGMSFRDRMQSFKSFQCGDVDIICCTDLASRGLDTQRAKHILNYDFPNNISDYVLRVGRVGRLGTNHGRVTNLVLKRSGVYVVQDIEMAVRNSAKLENVDANITKKIQKLYYSY